MYTKLFSYNKWYLVGILFLPRTIVAYNIPPDEVTPQVALDCGATANNPKRSGNYVIGTATISCISNHGVLKIRVSIDRSDGLHGPYLEKTCYNTWTCTVTGSTTSGKGTLPYYPVFWRTRIRYWRWIQFVMFHLSSLLICETKCVKGKILTNPGI